MLLMFAVIWVVMIPGGVVALAWAAAGNRDMARPLASARLPSPATGRPLKSLRRLPHTAAPAERPPRSPEEIRSIRGPRALSWISSAAALRQ